MSYNLTTMQSIYYNQDEIVEITYNGSPVYQKSSGPDYTEPFYVENITNSTETLSIKKSSTSSSIPTLTIEYKTDNTDWTPLGTTSTTALTLPLAPGDKIYLRCNTDHWAYSSSSSRSYSNSLTGVSKVGGNVMSLLYGNNFTGQETSFPTTASCALADLCRANTNLIDASKLLLPATTLAEYCYTCMFYSCTSLTAIPTFPATTLARYCYKSMFDRCSSLTTAPVLPATTLADYCYDGMFWGCSSLIQAPALPATTLAYSCYHGMFGECTFTQAPELPATTLASNCYSQMFQSCASLTQAPELPATTLASSCYSGMFLNCTLLNNVTCLATSGINTTNTYNWLSNVSATGTFTKAAGVTWSTGVSGIPSGWTIIEV